KRNSSCDTLYLCATLLRPTLALEPVEKAVDVIELHLRPQPLAGAFPQLIQDLPRAADIARVRNADIGGVQVAFVGQRPAHRVAALLERVQPPVRRHAGL